MLAGELTADVDQAALILRAHRVTVRELAASGALRGRKVGRCWVFVVSDLLAYIQGAHDPRPAADTPQPWEARSTSSAVLPVSTKSDSRHQVDAAYRSALGLGTNDKPKNSAPRCTPKRGASSSSATGRAGRGKKRLRDGLKNGQQSAA